MIRLLSRLLVLCFVIFAAPSLAQAPQVLPTSPLVIHSAKGPLKFTAELAKTEDQKAKGLMFRKSMPADVGMLFDYGADTPNVAFWMQNTFIPLDMLFIKADGHILNIHERAIPHDQSSIFAAGPVRAVLELNGGTVARLGIKPGDRVEHAIFSGR